MRVLVITPTPTHPATQGNRVRVAQIASALKASGAIVELLYYAMDSLDTSSVEAMRAAWDVLYVVPTGGYRPRRRFPTHWGVDDWVSPDLLEAVRFLAATTRYDAVLVNYVWCSLLLDVFPAGTLRVLDTHDAFGDRHIVARESGMHPHWYYTTKEEEARGLNRADILLAIQSEEARYFESVSSSRVVTIEYAAPPHFLPPRRGNIVNVGYIGSGNPWNVASLKLFDQVMSRLMARHAGGIQPQFLLFGGITNALPRPQLFQSIGMVDDVIDAYRAVDLVVNPMVGGTGLKIKTVEGLAFGRPVLSTRSGGVGLEVIHDDLCLEDIDALAARTLHLLQHRHEIVDLSAAMAAGYLSFHRDVATKLTALTREISR